MYIKFRGSVITKHLSGLQVISEKFQEKKTETGNNNSNKENHDTGVLPFSFCLRQIETGKTTVNIELRQIITHVVGVCNKKSHLMSDWPTSKLGRK